MLKPRKRYRLRHFTRWDGRDLEAGCWIEAFHGTSRRSGYEISKVMLYTRTKTRGEPYLLAVWTTTPPWCVLPNYPNLWQLQIKIGSIRDCIPPELMDEVLIEVELFSLVRPELIDEWRNGGIVVER